MKFTGQTRGEEGLNSDFWPQSRAYSRRAALLVECGTRVACWWRVLDKLVRGSGVGNDWCSFHAFSTRNFDRGFREKSTCGGEKRFAAFKIEGTVRFLKMILHVVPDWTGLPFWT